MMRELTEKEYEAVIEPMRQRKAAFQICFGASGAAAVLADLSRFCRADQSCWDADPRKHAVLEGRREVWLRIQQHLNMSPEQLVVLYRSTVPNIVEPENKEEA